MTSTVLYSPDELVMTLSYMFPKLDTIQLHKVMYDNKYNFDHSVEYLVQTQLIDSNSKKSIRRANSSSAYLLPNDFLRIPGWSNRHSKALNSQDYMNLLADPVFLR